MDQATESNRLATVKSLGILDTEPEQEFDEFAQLAAAICGVSTSPVTILDERRQFHKARVGLIDLQEIPRSTSFCEYTIQQNDVLVIEDALLDRCFAGNPLVVGKPEMRFYAGAPLTTCDSRNIGALCVLDVSARHLTDQQVSALGILAKQVVGRIELRQKRLDVDETLRKLRSSETLFRTFADNIPFEACLKDELGALIFYNQHLADRFGISLSDWIGKRNCDLWPARVAASLDDQERDVRSAMKQVQSTTSTPNSDGSETHWRLFQVPYETEEERFTWQGSRSMWTISSRRCRHCEQYSRLDC